MAELKERAIAIINDDTEFNNLPFEERKRICKYLHQTEIRMLYTLIEKDKTLTTEAWRDKQLSWLLAMVKAFESDYGKPKEID